MHHTSFKCEQATQSLSEDIRTLVCTHLLCAKQLCEFLQVVFSAVQLSWLNVEQAWAVTEEQWAELDAEQRHAVGLARYEGDVLMELRVVLYAFSSRFAVSSSDLTPQCETLSLGIEQDVKEAGKLSRCSSRSSEPNCDYVLLSRTERLR
ncbi:hypothetical protein XENORESO_015615 [Xenotaenia resolanae]|uniref:Uncharacterized protein n=1 Tax=Xenotaenia resolanae TaxID=208358 RepID=A0ABV0W5R1_9TELE